MGLLTDPSGLHGRPFQFLVKYEGRICVFLYVAAVVWYFLLAHEHVNSATYLSENALLPGLVTVGCDVSSRVKTLLEELEHEMSSHPQGLPTAWIRAKLIQSGIHPFTHNFTLNYPLGKGAKFTGKNLYGIINGGGASTESIVLSVPYRGKESAHPSTAPGLALLLAMASCFRKQKYWAKDIILLVTEHEQLGMQAWLEAYHGTSCGTPGILDAGEIMGRGGGIQAAINLELHSNRIRSIDVKLCGLNGQLPNLDLANLVHRICSKERVRHTFTNREKVQSHSAWDQWLHSLRMMTSMVLTQASGVPDGNHGLFHRFGIEALTLEGHEDGFSGPYVSLHHIGRVIEGIFRSINNLLERFHQSYFFYLLVDTDRFVSIGLYMPCVGMLVGALFIKAFAFHLNLKGHLQAILRCKSVSDLPCVNSVGVGVTILWCYALGLLTSSSSRFFSSLLPLPTDWALFIGYLIVTLLTFFVPPYIINKWYSEREWVLLEMGALVHLATLLIAIAMHNFSLAFMAGLFLVPMALSLGPSRNGKLVKALVLVSHPLFLVTLAVTLSAVAHFPLDEVLWRSLLALRQSLVLSVVDSMVYGSTTLTLVLLFYLPNWIMFWVVAQARVSCLDSPPTSPSKKTD